MKFLPAFAILAAAFVAEARIYFTTPVVGTNWTANATASIAWQVTPGTPSRPLRLELLQGNPANLTFVTDLGTADERRGWFNLTVDSKWPQSELYVIRGNGVDYSAAFTINNPNVVAGGKNATAGSNSTLSSSNNNNMTSQGLAVAAWPSMTAAVTVAILSVTSSVQ